MGKPLGDVNPMGKIKRCAHCHHLRDLSCFSLRGNGRHSCCRDCNARRSKEWGERYKARNLRFGPLASTKKICAKCRKEKDGSEFSPEPRTKCGLRSYCLACNATLRRAYRAKRKDEVNMQVSSRKRTIRLEVLRVYGGSHPSCACCGETRYEFLVIDHMNGRGQEQRDLLGRRGNELYLWLKQQGYPDGYRVLCSNCNSALGWHGYCPHAVFDQATSSNSPIHITSAGVAPPFPKT